MRDSVLQSLSRLKFIKSKPDFTKIIRKTLSKRIAKRIKTSATGLSRSFA